MIKGDKNDREKRTLKGAVGIGRSWTGGERLVEFFDLSWFYIYGRSKIRTWAENLRLEDLGHGSMERWFDPVFWMTMLWPSGPGQGFAGLSSTDEKQRRPGRVGDFFVHIFILMGIYWTWMNAPAQRSL